MLEDSAELAHLVNGAERARRVVFLRKVTKPSPWTARRVRHDWIWSRVVLRVAPGEPIAFDPWNMGVRTTKVHVEGCHDFQYYTQLEIFYFLVEGGLR